MADHRYRKLNTFLREAFGQKVYRVGLRGGFSCPNRDGSIGADGCIFCNPTGNEPYGYISGMSLSDQLDWGTEYIRRRHGADRFIAFFSDYSATYGDVERLERLYREAWSYPGMVGLALGTRPDCLTPEILDLLAGTARETFLWVELGIQSAHDRTLRLVNRCHTVADSRRAVSDLRERGVAVSGHVILGLPGEDAADILETAALLAECDVNSVKIHNLHVIRNTVLADMYRNGEYRSLELPEYVNLAVRFLEHIPPTMVVQRISGEAPRRLTVSPAWSVNKLAVVNAIDAELEARDSWQGKGLGYARSDLSTPVSMPGIRLRAGGPAIADHESG